MWMQVAYCCGRSFVSCCSISANLAIGVQVSGMAKPSFDVAEYRRLMRGGDKVGRICKRAVLNSCWRSGEDVSAGSSDDDCIIGWLTCEVRPELFDRANLESIQSYLRKKGAACYAPKGSRIRKNRFDIGRISSVWQMLHPFICVPSFD